MTTEFTVEQKIRQSLTGDPHGEPVFASQGEQVVYWLTGGNDPDVWVTLHTDGKRTVVRCAGCHNVIGELPADPLEKEEMVRQINAIRQAGHGLHEPADWPQMNVLNGPRRLI
jgi:hypothetical protein